MIVTGYRSAPGALIVRLRNALQGDGVLMITALAGKEAVASALLFIHGRAETYHRLVERRRAQEQRHAPGAVAVETLGLYR